MGTRDLRIDGVKFFLICLVIIGHFMQGARYNSEVTTALYSVIYNFHMPLFVLLSGWFFKSKNFAEVHKSNIKLLEPLIVFHIIAVHSFSLVNYLKFEPSPLWYILSLFAWRYIMLIINMLCKGGGGKICVSVTLSVLAFCTINKYEEFMSIMRTFQFLPFFVIGSEMSLCKGRLFQTKKFPFLIALLPLIAILSYFAGPKLCAIEFHKYGILGLSQVLGQGLYMTIILKYLVDIVAFVISLCVLRLIELTEGVAKYGKNTLFLYVVHVPFYFIIAHFCNNFIVSLTLAALFIVVFSMISMTQYAHYIMYPISSIIKKTKYA